MILSRATCLLLTLIFATIASTTAIKTDSSSRKLRGKRSSQVEAQNTRKKTTRKKESDKADGGGAGGVGGGDKKGGNGGGGDKKDGGDKKGGGGGGGDKKGGGGKEGGGGGKSDVVYEVNENKDSECDRSYYCANPTPVSSWSCAHSCECLSGCCILLGTSYGLCVDTDRTAQDSNDCCIQPALGGGL